MILCLSSLCSSFIESCSNFRVKNLTVMIHQITSTFKFSNQTKKSIVIHVHEVTTRFVTL